MKPELLQDAIGLLDEELIAPVEKLRRPKRLHWQHIGALAACLALVCALGIFGATRMGGSPEASRHDAAAELAVENETIRQEHSVVGRDDSTDVPGVDVVDEAEHAPIMFAVDVEVIEIEQDRFTATVLFGGRNLAPGDVVTVMLTESTRSSLAKEEGFSTLDGQHFFAGATLIVGYGPGQEGNVIYADWISFAE